MKKTAVALLLALSMMILSFTGCGEAAGSSSVSSTSSSSAAEPSEAVVSEDQDPEPAEAAAPEEASAEEQADEPSIAYPIAEGETLTAWVTLETPFRQAISDWNDLSVLPSIEEATGIALEFVTVGSDAASEQFPLMIAGGDWTDLVPISYYSGGDAQAYEDDVIVDLTDMLETDAPDYWAKAMSMDELSQSAMKSGDKYLTFYTLLNQYYLIQGTCMRQDWLDELGLDVPNDLDSLTEALLAIKDAYDPEYTIYTADGGLDYLSDLFDTMITGYSTMTGELPIHILDDTAVCTYTTDEYRAYLEWFIEMYKAGVVNDSFYSVNEMDGTVRNTYIAENDIALWSARCESIDEWKTYTSDENTLANANPQAIPFFTNEDGEFNWAEEQSCLYSRVSWCITTQCEDPSLALQFLNYFFTDEGSVLANYGVQGDTWEYDDAGEVAYTDLVLNNPDGLTAQLAVNVYTTSAILPCYSIEEKLFVAYCDNAQTAIQLYNTDVYADHVFPSASALSTEETNNISETVTAITTYSSEQLLKFMTCAEDLTDEAWAAYVNQMNSLGLEDCVAVYQNAYDEYLAGAR